MEGVGKFNLGPRPESPGDRVLTQMAGLQLQSSRFCGWDTEPENLRFSNIPSADAARSAGTAAWRSAT